MCSEGGADLALWPIVALRKARIRPDSFLALRVVEGRQAGVNAVLSSVDVDAGHADGGRRVIDCDGGLVGDCQ